MRLGASCLFIPIAVGIIVLAVVSNVLGEDTNQKSWLFVGTYTSKSKGIYRFDFDPATGKLTSKAVAAETVNPTFLAIHPNKKYLYAVGEIGNFDGKKTGAVNAFTIDPVTGDIYVGSNKTMYKIPNGSSTPALLSSGWTTGGFGFATGPGYVPREQRLMARAINDMMNAERALVFVTRTRGTEQAYPAHAAADLRQQRRRGHRGHPGHVPRDAPPGGRAAGPGLPAPPRRALPRGPGELERGAVLTLGQGTRPR